MEECMKKVVVIPTYNEKENIVALLKEIHEIIPDISCLVVDDNSPDGTGKIVDEIAKEDKRVMLLPRAQKMGLASAYKDGFKRCLELGFDVICQMDSDFSHQPRFLPSLIAGLETADVVLGSRYTKGGGTVDWGLKRKVLSKGGNLYARIILGVRIKDLTGGFKAFKRQVLEVIGLDSIKSEGYAFQMEVTYRAIRHGFKVIEVPIIFPDRKAGKSKLSSSIFWESLFMPWRLRFSKV
jgi:dolichol-phosphate mannosyltransferase